MADDFLSAGSLSHTLQSMHEKLSQLLMHHKTLQTLFVVSIIWVVMLTVAMCSLCMVAWRRMRRIQRHINHKDAISVASDHTSHSQIKSSPAKLPVLFDLEDQPAKPSFSRAPAIILNNQHSQVNRRKGRSALPIGPDTSHHVAKILTDHKMGDDVS